MFRPAKSVNWSFVQSQKQLIFFRPKEVHYWAWTGKSELSVAWMNRGWLHLNTVQVMTERRRGQSEGFNQSDHTASDGGWDSQLCFFLSTDQRQDLASFLLWRLNPSMKMTWKLQRRVGSTSSSGVNSSFMNCPLSMGMEMQEKKNALLGNSWRERERESDTVWDWEWLENPREGRDRATQHGER